MRHASIDPGGSSGNHTALAPSGVILPTGTEVGGRRETLPTLEKVVSIRGPVKAMNFNYDSGMLP